MTLSLEIRLSRRGPEGPAARGEGFSGTGRSVGASGLVGARAGGAWAAGRLEQARSAMGRLTLIPRSELGLLSLIVLDLLLGLRLGDHGLIGWGVGGLAVWCSIAYWRSGGARNETPAGPLPNS